MRDSPSSQAGGRRILTIVDPWAKPPLAPEAEQPFPDLPREAAGPNAPMPLPASESFLGVGEARARGRLRAMELPTPQAVRKALPLLLSVLAPATLALAWVVGDPAPWPSAHAFVALQLVLLLLLWILTQPRTARPAVWVRSWLSSRARSGRSPWAATAVTALASAALLLPAWLAGWTAAAGTAVPDTAVSALIVLVSVAGSVLLAPSLPLLALSAGLPLVMVLTWSAAAASSAQPSVAIVSVAGLTALSAAWLGLLRHREWRATQRERLALQDRIKTAEIAAHAAQRSEEDKTRFLAIASHDLRQPVHAVGLFAAALDKRLQGTPDEYLVRNVMRAIEGLDRSFNAMLDISRLDAGSIEPNVQHFALRDLFRRLHMHFAGQAEVAGLSLRLSPGGKSVSSDPQLLERVLSNLVQNALKYTEHGGVVVVARSTATHINVEVWDTGPGIAPQELPLIFNEFYQIGHGERDRTRGLGMGLAIVKRLVALMGHSLTVASQEGKGTLFRIGIAHGGLPGIAEAVASSDTVPMPVPLAQMILVVDDEAAIRDGLRILLEEWGCHVIAVGSAEEAEQTVRALRAPIDLIISDLHLGEGADGLTVIERVRHVCGYEVPAMVVTGDTSPQEMRRLSDSGHVVLFKPVQPRKLFSMLRSFGS